MLPSIAKAIDTAHLGSPATKARVPSIGSAMTSADRATRAVSSVVSSESQPASGNSAPRRARRNRSTARSALVTGEPPSLYWTFAPVLAPEAKSRIAISPPRRAASTSAASAWAARASRPASMGFALVMARALLYWRRGSRAMGSPRFCSRARERGRREGPHSSRDIAERTRSSSKIFLVPVPSRPDRLLSTHRRRSPWRRSGINEATREQMARPRSRVRSGELTAVATSVTLYRAMTTPGGAMPESSGHVLETLWEDEEFVLFWGWNGEPFPLLAAAPSAAQPSPESLARLQYSYALPR